MKFEIGDDIAPWHHVRAPRELDQIQGHLGASEAIRDDFSVYFQLHRLAHRITTTVQSGLRCKRASKHPGLLGHDPTIDIIVVCWIFL